jgi:predicted transport protein
MPLFSLRNDKLEKINKVDFNYEIDIQKLTEENLRVIFGLEFVETEFQLNNLRIDTLAFDNETNSFVIIEYKREKNFSVIDQGYAYLALLLNNKADFILEYNEVMDNFLKKNGVEWSQSRVIFVAPQFTRYQQHAIEFKDLPIELWEISKYTNESVLFNQLKSPDSSESINTVSSGSKVVQRVSSEVEPYTEEKLFKYPPEEIKELYFEIKRRILNLDDNIEIKPFANTIAFKIDKHILNVSLQKTQLKIWLNLKKGELDDPRKTARDVSEVGHWGLGDYEISLKHEDDLDYLMTLIKQSYKENQGNFSYNF